MKIAVVADLHWGARGDSNIFLDHFSKFYREIFFPYIEKENIKVVFLAGDLVDRRKFINFNTLQKMRKEFLEPLSKYEVHAIVGNHDAALKNTIELNALTELMEQYGFNIYTEATEVQVGSEIPILMLPWICQENYDRSLEMIKNTKAQICLGHLELEGFEMHMGTICNEGMSVEYFDKFDVVMTGHFHHKSSRANINYLGAPYQITWADYEDPRGFHIFDTDTRELEYIQNSYKMFNKIVYSDKDKNLDDVMSWDFDFFKNTYVKVFVETKTNPYWFDMFIDELEKRAIDVKIQEEIVINDGEDSEHIEECENIVTTLQKYVKASKIKCDREKLQSLLVQLYNEASQLEVA